MDNSSSPNNNDKITILSNYNASDAYKDVLIVGSSPNRINMTKQNSSHSKEKNKMASPAYIS